MKMKGIFSSVILLLAALPAAAQDGGMLITITPSGPSTQVLRLHNDQLNPAGLQAVTGTVRSILPGPDSGRLVAVTEAETGQATVHFLEVQSYSFTSSQSLTLPAGQPKVILATPDRARLLVATAQPNRLYEVDLSQKQLSSQQELPWEPMDAAFTRDGEILLLLSRTNILQPLRIAGWQWLTPVPIAGGFPDGSLSVSVSPAGHVYISGPNAVVKLSGVPPFDELARTIIQNPVFTHPGKLLFTASGTRAFAIARAAGNHSIGVFDLTGTTSAPAGSLVATGVALSSSSGPGLIEPEPLDQLLIAGEDLAFGRAYRINQPFQFRVSAQGGITTQDIRIAATPILNSPGIAISDEIPSAAHFYTAETQGRVYRISTSTGAVSLATLTETVSGIVWVAQPSTKPAARLFVYPSASTLEPDKPLRIYARAVDAQGHPVRGASIRLTSSGGDLNILASRQQTDAEGFAWFEIASPSSTALSLQLSDATGAASATLNFSAGSANTTPGDVPSAATPKLLKVAGDGQLKPNGSVFDFLVVKAVDAQGNPMPGKLVRWSTNSTAIGFVGDPATLTDTAGEARITLYRITPMSATTAFEQFTIFATSDVGSVTFYATEFPNDLPGYPNIYQEAPSTLDPTITLKLGKPTSDLLVISVRSGIGDGRPSQLPIPNVGIQVRSVNQDPKAGPVIECAEGIGLSNRDGKLTCALLAKGRIGETHIRADVGNLVYYDQIRVIVEPGDPVPPVIVSGNNQLGKSGTTLPNRLVARVVDAGGNPLPGTKVIWSVSNANALTLIDTIDTADSKGEVSTGVRLGGIAGTFTVSVKVGTLQSNFTVTVQSTATTLRKVSGDNQTEVLINTAFPQPLVVEVLNQQNAPLQGITVQWSIAGPGTLSSASTTTGSNGRAQVNVTAGSTPGTITVTASVAGLPAVSFTLQSRLPGPAVTAASFVNYSTRKGGTVAPGALVLLTASGIARNVTGLAVATQNIVTGQLPLILKGLVVEFRSGGNTYYAPIYWIARDGNSETALIQVPYEITGPTVSATVYVDSVGTTVQNLPVAPVSPGILTDQIDGRTAALALGSDGRLITKLAPARPGETVRLFAIGLGPTTPPAETNRVGLPGQKTAGEVIIGFDGAGITPSESKLAENLIGIYEVQFVVPENATPGDHILGLGVRPPNSTTVYYAQEEGAPIPVGPAK